MQVFCSSCACGLQLLASIVEVELDHHNEIVDTAEIGVAKVDKQHASVYPRDVGAVADGNFEMCIHNGSVNLDNNPETANVNTVSFPRVRMMNKLNSSTSLNGMRDAEVMHESNSNDVPKCFDRVGKFVLPLEVHDEEPAKEPRNEMQSMMEVLGMLPNAQSVHVSACTSFGVGTGEDEVGIGVGTGKVGEFPIESLGDACITFLHGSGARSVHGCDRAMMLCPVAGGEAAIEVAGIAQGVCVEALDPRGARRFALREQWLAKRSRANFGNGRVGRDECEFHGQQARCWQHQQWWGGIRV